MFTFLSFLKRFTHETQNSSLKKNVHIKKGWFQENFAYKGNDDDYDDNKQVCK
jgi:hypothetical protein